MRNKKGFSLLEILVAVAVVSIISVLGVQTYTKHIKSAKLVEAKAEAAVLELAMSQYNISHPTAKLSTIDVATLSSSGLLQSALKFNTDGEDKCTYSYKTYNNGTFTTTEKHVVLESCTFAETGKIITAEGVF